MSREREKGGDGGGGGEVNGAREKTNENDGIDFDRDGATLGNRATAPLALPPLSWHH